MDQIAVASNTPSAISTEEGTEHGSNSQRVVLAETAPLWLEVGVVGGLGFAVYFGPAIYDIIRGSVNVVWPRISGCIQSTLSTVKRRMEPISRRRRRGSLIRVIAYLLPDCVFEPPTRIFVPGIHRHVLSTYGCSDVQTLFNGSPSQHDNKSTLPVGQGAEVIVAFELDAESEFTDTDDIDEDVSSNPEGWEPHITTFPMPFANSTAFQCSTPTPALPDLCYQNALMNDTTSTEATDCDDNGETKEQLAVLQRMIQDLTKKMEVYDQINISLALRQNQTASINPDKQDSMEDLPPPPQAFLNSPPLPAENVGILPPPPPMPSSGVSGPPPPPPPPMPSTVFQGSVPIKITKSKGKEPPKAAVQSMMDVLKDLNKVKLRSVQRSPGGTPVKEKYRNNDRNSLEYALKKRFESMHSPAGSDDENLSFLMDKENEFEDSILQSTAGQQKNLFGRRMSRKSSTLRNRNFCAEKKYSEKSNTPPFGPHLLKKRNQNEPFQSSNGHLDY